MKEKENLKRLKKTLLAAGMATVMATTPMAVSASIPEAKIEHNVEDEKDVIARTNSDWEKLKKAYAAYDCNLDTESIEALLEIEEYIEANYSVYYNDALSANFTVDDVIAYRNDQNTEFNFAALKADYAKLNKEDDKAVAAFLEKYGKYLADLHAHNYFTIITILATIRNDVAWYVKQDVQNSDWAALTNGSVEAEAYRFSDEEYKGGKLSSDLTTLELDYKNKEVVVNITAPNDEYETVGDGFTDIQTVYLDVLKEANYLGKYFTGNLKEEDKKYFLGNDTFATNGTTVDAKAEIDQVYGIKHNNDINALIREGLRVVKTLTPATTYDYEELYALGVDVTALGYGHWFVGNPIFNYTYDEKTKMYHINLDETFECPTLSYEEVINQNPSLKR